ncbi:hypothetical protein [Streptomyces sp. NBC_01506]|uniref:hypothetical protein n=1 Tax=Streptomyces sp. NBC_01506 TaxID=2903887 RepID=UPI0038650F5B
MNEHLSQAGFLDGPRNKDQIRADAWKWDERMEALATLKESQPETFDHMGITARMSLGYYENNKKNAADHGRNVNKGGK